IRGLIVTGVQTCALPISAAIERRAELARGPISVRRRGVLVGAYQRCLLLLFPRARDQRREVDQPGRDGGHLPVDRADPQRPPSRSESTRLNSSHDQISYA